MPLTKKSLASSPDAGTDPTITTLTEGQVPKANETQKLVYSGATVNTLTGEWVFDDAVVIMGNFTINGTTTSVDSENLHVADTYIGLNSGYTVAANKTTGWHGVAETTGLSDTVSGGNFGAGTDGFTNPEVVTNGLGTFSAGQFIQLSLFDVSRNGIYEVLSHSGPVLTIRGVGTVATVEDFTQNQFVSGVDTGRIDQVVMNVVRFNSSNLLEEGSGSVTPIVYSVLSAPDPAESFATTLGVDNISGGNDVIMSEGDIIQAGLINLEAESFIDESTQTTGATQDGIGWHIDTLELVDFKSVNSSDTQPQGMFVRPNGANVYMCGNQNDEIHQFDMSTKWGVASLTDPGFNIPSEGTNPKAMFWRPNGRALFVIHSNNNLVQFVVSPDPWDVNGGSENGTISMTALGVSNATAMWWHPSGLRFYFKDSSNLVKEFLAANPWDINTAPTAGKTFDAGFGGGMLGFDPTGTIMYLSDGTNIYEYDLDAWDLDNPVLITATPHGLTSPRAISLKPDGTKFFALDASTDLINEFTLGIKTPLAIIGGQTASRVAPAAIEIFEASELDALTAISTTTTAIINGPITTLNEFALESAATVKFDSGDFTSTLLYSGTDTFISGNGGLRTEAVDFISLSTGTFTDITGGSFTRVNLHNAFLAGWDDLGVINDSSLVMVNNSFADIASGWAINNSNINASAVGLEGPDVIQDGGSLFDISADITVAIGFSGFSGGLSSGSLLRIDPALEESSSCVITNNPITSGSLFDTAGVTGTFTNVVNNSIGATAVTAVSDSLSTPGVARFATATTPLAGSTADLSTFAVETSYNTSGVVTAISAGVWFEIATIPWVQNDSGSYAVTGITVTAAAHGQSPGQTLTLDADLSAHYSGKGYAIYNVVAGAFDVAETFDAGATAGDWDTAGLDHTDPRVLSQNNKGFADSLVDATGESHGNDSPGVGTIITDGVYIAVQFGTFVSSSEQRLKHLGNNKYEVTSKEPVILKLEGNSSQIKSGATARSYRLAISIDGALPVYNVDPALSDPYEDLSVTSDPVKTHVLLFTPTLIEGQTVELMVAGQGNSDDLTFHNSTFIWGKL